MFRSWATEFSSSYIELFAIQLPGRENRFQEPPITNLASLIRELTLAIVPYLDRPFAFFGHSLGALISFEVARQLRQQHLSPMHLIVSSRHAPQLPALTPPIHRLPTLAFIEALRRYQGTPESVLQHQELMQMFLPMLRADFMLNETYLYTHAHPLECPISAFGGRQDEMVSSVSLDAWQVQTSSKFERHTFAGNHFYLKNQQKELLFRISNLLQPQIHCARWEMTDMNGQSDFIRKRL